MIDTSVWATMVVYYPDDDTLDYIRTLSDSINLVVIDNTPDGKYQKGLCQYYIHNGANLGVASAFNQGMQLALAHGAKWCLLLDQDSRIDPKDILHLLEYAHDACLENLALVAPIYFCNNVNRYGKAICIEDQRIHRHAPEQWAAEAPFMSVSYTISSGSLMNLQACKKIGWYDESLFIDFVDIEWGLRAKEQGYQLHMIHSVCLQHQIGCEPIKLGKKQIVNHSSLRHYYYFRNLFLMMRKSHVPMIWKAYELAKLPARFVLYSLLTENKSGHAIAMTRGFIHGLFGKKGKAAEKLAPQDKTTLI